MPSRSRFNHPWHPDWRGRQAYWEDVRWAQLPEFDVAIALYRWKCGPDSNGNLGNFENRWYLLIRRFGEEQIYYQPVLSQTIITSSPGSTQTITLDATWNNANNSIELVAGGGSGCASSNATTSAGSACGGGGGEYGKTTNFTNPGGNITIQVGGGGTAVATPTGAGTNTVAGNNGSDSWFNGASQAAATLGAIHGNGSATGANNSGAGGTGGVGATHNAGGRGGNVSATTGRISGGGGGAGGSTAAGAQGGDSTTSNTGTNGGAADVGGTGAGGGGTGGTTNPGGNGGNGTEFDSTHGCGGGGGGCTLGANLNGTGGSGGNYGGGGAGCSNIGSGSHASTKATSGAGAQGIVVLNWTPSAGATITPPAGTLTLTTGSPQDELVSIATRTLVLTGNAPTVLIKVALYPVSDDALTAWVNEMDGVPLYPSVDESSPSDVDFIRSSYNPIGDVCRFAIDDPGVTLTAPVDIFYRIGKVVGQNPVNLAVRLLQGTTLIREWTHVDVGSALTTVQQTLSAGELAQITDFGNLFVEFEATSYVGPGDLVPNAFAFWGLRAYSRATIGQAAISLLRDSDNSVKDFNTVADGGLDLAGILAWKDVAGPANLLVEWLYDQTGNGQHLFRAGVAGGRPAFVLNGLGAQPVMRFDGAVTRLLVAPSITRSQPVSGIAVSRCTAFAGGSSYATIGTQRSAADDNGIWWKIPTAGGGLIDYYHGPESNLTEAAGGPPINTWATIQWIANGASSRLDANGISSGTITTGTGDALNSGGGNFYLGYDDTSSHNILQGEIQEFGYWSGSFADADFAALNRNQQNYWGIYDYSTYAWIATVTANGGTVSTARGDLVNALIVGLKTDGIWSKYDHLWLYAAQNSGAALIDIVGRKQATAVGSPTFTPNVGFTGGSSKYIDTNTNPSTDGGHYTQTNAHWMVWQYNTAPNTGGSVGSSPAASQPARGYLPYTDNKAYWRLNFNDADEITAGPFTNAQGMWVASSSNAGISSTLYQNGAVVGTSGVHSQDTPTDFIGLANSNTGLDWYFDVVSAFGFGGNLTAAEVAKLYSRLQLYMLAVGAEYKIASSPFWARYDPFGAPGLINGVDYIERISVNPATFPGGTTITWDWPTPHSTVYSYPGLAYGNQEPGENSPAGKQLNAFAALSTSIDYEFTGSLDDLDILHEMWLYPTATLAGGGPIYEVEILLAPKNGAQPAIYFIFSITTPFAANVYLNTNSSPPSFLIYPNSNLVGAVTIDWLAIYNQIIAHGYLTGNEYAYGFELGVEVFQGQGSMTISNFSVTWT